VVLIDFDRLDKDDEGNCLYCGQKCWQGDMCDEQQAGGFNAPEVEPEEKGDRETDEEEIQRRDEKNGLYGGREDIAN